MAVAYDVYVAKEKVIAQSPHPLNQSFLLIDAVSNVIGHALEQERALQATLHRQLKHK